MGLFSNLCIEFWILLWFALWFFVKFANQKFSVYLCVTSEAIVVDKLWKSEISHTDFWLVVWESSGLISRLYVYPNNMVKEDTLAWKLYCAMSGKSLSMLYYFWIFPITSPIWMFPGVIKWFPIFFFLGGGRGWGGGRWDLWVSYKRWITIFQFNMLIRRLSSIWPLLYIVGMVFSS